MKIAITGSRGSVGKETVRLCAERGHHTVQVNRTDQEYDGTPNSEMRTADATDYDACLKSFEGCDAIIHLAAIPNPRKNPHHQVHSNNVVGAFNGLHAAAELGIRRFCYASSVNAIGLAFSNQPNKFPYFPIDEDFPPNCTDSYALAKLEAEIQCKAFANWYPGLKIAAMRIHQVEPRETVRKEHEKLWEESAVKQLFGWVNPTATARACILAVENADDFEGCEIFNIVAPDTTQDTPSAELAKKYHPEAEIREGLEGNNSFWKYGKAKIIGWEHTEKE
ncbi:putative UDP-galactose 4-epimerase [Polychaeton citri CBS 116435]|uniref:UDP-galactose 4-epimerase n=1 Tax=Polychaeton citri CBS 116435 TaxID=1314669 RepID=A0A9P4QAB8_9PEZI|nr:putative UDP-galactose 4-epimerase [Polychaeton citri CBS 116435]